MRTPDSVPEIPDEYVVRTRIVKNEFGIAETFISQTDLIGAFTVIDELRSDEWLRTSRVLTLLHSVREVGT